MAAGSGSTPKTMTANVRDTREAGNGNGMWQDQDGWSKCNATTRVSGLDVDAEMHGHARREPARRRHAHRRKSTGATGLRVRIFENQIGLALVPLLALAMLHYCFPRFRHRTEKFYRLSYHDPMTDRYEIGTDDFYVVLYWIVLLTGLRAGAMSYLFIPFARWAGVKKRKGQVRFAEQAWLFCYDTPFFSLGAYIFYHSDYWLNLREMWTTWPDRTMDGLLKRYYLIQFAFWLQQILVVNIEERRKDYHQMLTHHIITCSLIFSSYGHHVTKVGNVILCLMEIVDVILPLAKLLKYLHFHVACDVAFAVFMVTWVVARHALYMMVVHSAYRDTKDAMPFACFDKHGRTVERPRAEADSLMQVLQPFIEPDGVSCFNPKVKWTFLSMLLALQVIMLIWFGMIVRVAWRIVKGGTAEDSRSDDEADTEEQEDDHEAGEEEEKEKEEDEDEDEEEGALEPDLDMYTDADLVEEAKRNRNRNRKRKTRAGPNHVSLAPLEREVGVEAIDLSARARPIPGTRRYRTKLTAGSTAVTLPGHHSDRKELLGRIGCDKTG